MNYSVVEQYWGSMVHSDTLVGNMGRQYMGVARMANIEYQYIKSWTPGRFEWNYVAMA